MMLKEDEQYLNAGRFHAYCETVNDEMVASKPLVLYDPIVQFETLVNWINDNINCKWALTIMPHHVRKFECTFYFSDEVDAVHFALRWR